MENRLSLSLTFDGHRVRMAGTPECPLWVAKDVCFVLGLHGAGNVARDVPADEKGVFNLMTPGGPQEYVCVTESGLYRLVARSRKPAAQRFQRWLFNDVLPSVRKFGCYPPPAAPALPPPFDLRDHRTLAVFALQLTEIVAEKDQRIAELTPKAEGFDRLSNAEGATNLQEAGKALGLGPNRLQWRLLDEGVLFRGRHGKAEPKQEHVEAGRFVLRVREVDGYQFVQTLVTPKGLTWLAQRYPDEVRTGALVQ